MGTAMPLGQQTRGADSSLQGKQGNMSLKSILPAPLTWWFPESFDTRSQPSKIAHLDFWWGKSKENVKYALVSSSIQCYL
jgi:hypothetical protein